MTRSREALCAAAGLAIVACCGMGGEKKAREYLEDSGYENIGLDSSGMGEWTFVADKDGQSCTGTITVQGSTIKSTSECGSVHSEVAIAPAASGCKRLTPEETAASINESLAKRDRAIFDEISHPMLARNMDDPRFELYADYHDELGTLSSPRLVSLEQTATFEYDTDTGPVTMKVVLDECQLRSFDYQGEGMAQAIAETKPDFGLIYFQFQNGDGDANPTGDTYSRNDTVRTFAEITGITNQSGQADILITIVVKDGSGQVVHEDKVEGPVTGADVSGLLNFNFRFKLDEAGKYTAEYAVTDRMASKTIEFSKTFKVE